MGQLTAIIGDVHGCIAELETLLTLLPKGCRIVFAGDLVDRGPDSPAVVKLARSLGAECVMGNHDHKHVRHVRRGRQEVAHGRPAPEHNSQEITTISAALSTEDQDWMAAFPHYIKLPGNVLVVHAGLPRDVTFLPPQGDIDGYSRKRQGKYNQLWFVRYIDSETGKMVGSTFSMKPGLEFWAINYDGYLGHVYYGHQPYKQPEPIRDVYATGIDLACAFGGWLCAVIVDETGAEVDCITVKAEDTYNSKYTLRTEENR